jgi:hypothetical protein
MMPETEAIVRYHIEHLIYNFGNSPTWGIFNSEFAWHTDSRVKRTKVNKPDVKTKIIRWKMIWFKRSSSETHKIEFWTYVPLHFIV